MAEDRAGQVVTFYSYKGGTGRTMALANVAWILASAGRRVLVADWDLEAPGLHRFFAPFTRPELVDNAKGVIDLVRRYEDEVPRDAERPSGWVEQVARIGDYAFSVDWTFPNGGALDMLTAGRQNAEYAPVLGSLDWDTFYDRLGGTEFLTALRDDMRRRYDYALIDSRTGFSDVADICTQHLPDVLVDCFTLSNQGIEGAARVARAVASRNKRQPIRILPVAMRVDQGEKEKADAGRILAMRSFPGLPTGLSEADRAQFFSSVEVPYQTFYAYEETLATFGDKPGSPTSLLAAYERLTAVITEGEVSALAPMDEALRTGWRARFERRLPVEKNVVRLRYVAEDQVWAEWTGATLEAAGVTALDDGPFDAGAAPHGPTAGVTALTVVSQAFLAAVAEARDRWTAPELALLVEDVRLREVAGRNRTSVVGLDEAAATERLLALLGRVGTGPGPGTAIRFPGTEPRWFDVPARNPRFTGRTAELRRLRRELGAQGRAVVLPVALHGLGGIGKTQLALEYAHRFRSAYDLVWWIQADPSNFVDTALTDLGNALGLSSETATAGEAARATLEALRHGRATHRWLLVFDNADDIAHVRRFLPQGGGGHLILTSRNASWQEHANSVPVDVFQRQESIAHLRSRTPAISAEQAGQVAQALGDLPIAVSLAGAWLAETGTSVADYLDQIERSGGGTRWVQATWDLSLQRLQEQNPGAYRLLELCSVMAPEVALELLYSDGLTRALVPLDPSVEVRDMRGALVQQINRLALLKLDTASGRIQVHRLLQDVVRNRMTDDEEARTRHEVHVALAAFRPFGEPDDPRTWPRFRMIWPHLEISDAPSCTEEAVRQLSIDRVRYLWRRGDLPLGLELGTSIVATWTAALAEIEGGGSGTTHEPGPDSSTLRRQLLHLRFNVANILRDQARFIDAMTLDEDVRAAQTDLLGAQHSHTLMTSGSLAADLRALGRYTEALELDEGTNAAWLKGFGEDHPRTLAAANNLAASQRAVGNFRRALAIDEDVLERRRKVLGRAHPYALHSQTSLGRDLREAGEYEESVDILHNVHAVSRDRLGPDAVGTLNAQANLAASLRSAGRPEEAAPLLEEAYQKLTARFGPDNPNTLACRLNRSTNLLATGRVAEAFTEIREVTTAYQKALGVEHPFSLICLSNQSAAWRRQGQLPRAAELADTAAEGCGRLLGDAHPYYLAAAMNRATCVADGGDVETAAAETAALAERMTEVLGDRHPDALGCRGNLALLREATPGAVTVAAPPGSALTRAVRDLADRLGETHPNVRSLQAGRLLYRVTDPQDPF